MTKALADPETLVVGWSIWALGRMEKSAAAAEPALQQIAADSTRPEALKKAAVDALDQINGKKK